MLPDVRTHVDVESRDPYIGRVLGDRFTILKLIGYGGMGKVYKALQAPLERVVALKVLHPSHANVQDVGFQQRFFLEATLTSKLRHPNTVTLHDYGHAADGVFFIAMEYLEGKTLAALLQEGGPVSWARAVHIAQQICRSLREAHRVGVVHRDLKPANVMLVNDEGDEDLVKVLDFGLASVVAAPRPGGTPVWSRPSDPETTEHGPFFGSPLYMAPEQANSASDHRADIYSLGVVLYHMLVGHPPFQSQDAGEVMAKHLSEPPPPIRQVRPHFNIPLELEAAVMRCLKKAPADRYQSMEEVLEALKRIPRYAAEMESRRRAPRTLSQEPSSDVTVPMQALDLESGPQRIVPASEFSETDAMPSLRPASASDEAIAARLMRALRGRCPVSAMLGACALGGLVAFGIGRATVDTRPAPSSVVLTPTTSPLVTPRAWLRVHSQPSGAEVWESGQLLGRTPLVIDRLLSPDGAAFVTLELRRDGYHPLEATARAGAGEVTLAYELVKKPAPSELKRPEPRPAPEVKKADATLAKSGERAKGASEGSDAAAEEEVPADEDPAASSSDPSQLLEP